MRARPADVEPVVAALEQVVAETMRAGEVLRGLRRRVHRDDGPREVVDMARVVHHAVRVLEPQAHFHRVDLRIAGAAQLPPVEGEASSMRYRVSNTNWDQMIASSANISASTIVQSASMGNNGSLSNRSWNFSLELTAGSGYRFSLQSGDKQSTVQWSAPFNGTSQLRSFDAIELLMQAGSAMPSGVSAAYIQLTNLAFTGLPTTGTLLDMKLDWPNTGQGYATQWITAPGTDLSKIDWTLRGTVVAGLKGNPSGDLAERLKLNIKTTDAPLNEVPEPATMILLGSGLVGIGVLRMRR